MFGEGMNADVTRLPEILIGGEIEMFLTRRLHLYRVIDVKEAAVDTVQYYQRVLEELENSLKQEKKFLDNLKGLSRQCEDQVTKAPDTLPALLTEWEARKTSVERAIKEVKAQIK